MTDFLHRLVARTLGLAPVAQPLVPTMFAPSRQVESIDSIPERVKEGGEDPGVKTRPSVDPSRATLPEPIRLSDDARYDDLPAPRHPDSGPRAVSRLEVSAESPPIARDEPAPPASIVGTHRVAEQIVARAAISLPSETAREPKAETASKPKPPEPSGSVPLATRSVVFPMVVRQLPKSVPADSMEESLLMSTAAWRDQPQNSAPRTPVIRVTIGRIDVRAEFPPPALSPAPAKQAQTPTLSLDEYLKQRNEGKR